VNEFLGWLTDSGAYCKRRRTKGRDMMGACGQLGNEQVRKRKLVNLTASASE
jgi:adenine C2-methylase RlmN of 23S rRNA A2503 and tRNA A37